MAGYSSNQYILDRKKAEKERPSTIDYNNQKQKEYYDRQMADVAKFKAEQQKRIDFKNETSMQKLKNIGALNLRDRQEQGATKRTNLEQLGQTTRTGITDTGNTTRQGMADESAYAVQGLRNAGDLDTQFVKDRKEMERLRLTEQGYNERQANDLAYKRTGRDFDQQTSRFNAGLTKDGLGGTTYDPTLTDAFDALGSNQQSNNNGPSIPQNVYDATMNNQPEQPAQPVPVKLQDIPANNVEAIKKKKKNQVPLGQNFINSNLGHTLGLDKARTIANNFNSSLGQTWIGLSNLGQGMIDYGIKPAYDWSSREHKKNY